MNELDLFRPEEKTVTTKELAEILGVSERTIRDTAKNKGVEGTFQSLKTNGGVQSVKVFNEQQATLIKQEIQNHHNLATRQIDSVSTEIEENESIMKAMQILVMRDTKLKKELANANQKLIEQAPKVTAWEVCINDEDYLCFRDCAKTLGVKEQLLMSYLRNHNWVLKDRKPTFWSNENGFAKEFPVQTLSKTQKFQTKISKSGLEYLANRVEKIKDEEKGI